VDFFVDVSPDVATVCPGGEIVFTAEVAPAGSFVYQWTEDGADLPGATSSTLAVTKGAIASHTYNCRVTEPGSCTNVDPVAGIGSWIQDPPNVEFYPASFPQQTLGQLCGDGDGDVEPGEIWGLDVGVINRTLCSAAPAVTTSRSTPIPSSTPRSAIRTGPSATSSLRPTRATASRSRWTRARRAPASSSSTSRTSRGAAAAAARTSARSPSPSVGGGCQVATTCACASIVLGEVSPPGAAVPLTVSRSGSLVDLTFAKVAGATHYNVYISTQAATLPFAVASAAVGKRDCQVPWVSQLGGKGLILGYDVEAGIATSNIHYILITGDKGPATEGPLGTTSAGAERFADWPCAD
jgi:hypothetical protein